MLEWKKHMKQRVRKTRNSKASFCQVGSFENMVHVWPVYCKSDYKDGIVIDNKRWRQGTVY